MCMFATPRFGLHCPVAGEWPRDVVASCFHLCAVGCVIDKWGQCGLSGVGSFVMDWCDGPAILCQVLMGFLRWISPAT
jgi:hypothetical protein